MSNGDSRDDGPLKRQALGDVTNRCRKRDFSSVTPKFVSGNHANFENVVFEGAEGLVSKKGKTCIPQTADGKVKGPVYLTAARPGKYVIPGPAGGGGQEYAPPNAPRFARETEKLGVMEGDGSRDSCLIFGSAPGRSNISDDSSQESEDSQEDGKMDNVYFSRNAVQMEKMHDISSSSYEKIVSGGDILTQELFDKPCSTGSSGPSGSLDFKTAGIKGAQNLHSGLVGDGSSIEDIMAPGKACSCSLCLKAAYMWTDLHYQDTRGRLAALKKSRSHARSLEVKFHGQDPTAKFARDYSQKSAELEFDLMQRCRSLFLHTEDALVRETAQLHTNLLRLKELRENRKQDLETISDKL